MVESVGELIERRRIAAGFRSRTALAKAAGLSETTVRRLITTNSPVEPATLAALARIPELKVTYQDLMLRAGILPEVEEQPTPSELTAEEREMLEMVRDLPPRRRDTFMRLLRDLAEASDEERQARS